nr:tigger transposable element-derived protein 6-like [Rhipicephalus microplus]
MTADLFKDWLTKLDREFALSKCNVWLLVDQCSAHVNVPPLSAIHVAYLPANTTSVLQLLDQGIIKNVKVLHRKHLERMLLCMDNANQYEVSLLSAIHMLARAWGRVKDEIIANCFRTCGFIPSGGDDDASCTVGEDTSDLDVDGLLPALDDVPFEEYIATDNSVKTCGSLSDAEIVEMVRPSEPSHETEVDDDAAASVMCSGLSAVVL